jgi:two-component system chemotaxis response regulator CheY
MRALIIDDSRAMRAIIRKTLTEVGIDVVEAGDGREGLELLRQAPDTELVLIDWNMPVMNGIDFVKAVRSDRTFDPVRIMMVTTETSQDQLIRALETGANEYLMKPFTKDVLVAKLSLLDAITE